MENFYVYYLFFLYIILCLNIMKIYNFYYYFYFFKYVFSKYSKYNSNCPVSSLIDTNKTGLFSYPIDIYDEYDYNITNDINNNYIECFSEDYNSGKMNKHFCNSTKTTICPLKHQNILDADISKKWLNKAKTNTFCSLLFYKLLFYKLLLSLLLISVVGFKIQMIKILMQNYNFL